MTGVSGKVSNETDRRPVDAMKWEATKKKLLLLALLAAVIGMVVWFEPARFLSLAVLRDELVNLRLLIAVHPVLAAGTYLALFVVVAALSLPGAAILTIAAGALFGLLQGTLLASFASAIGATFAFWTSRYFLRGSVERRFPAMVRRIDRGIAEEGNYYLFAMRLMPLFPFFMLNLVMGLTRLRTAPFYWLTQLGMLPVTVVYANAGTQLGRVGSAADILSPAVVGSLALLGVFPLLARRLAGALRARHRYARYRRPDCFDANLVVIGAGATGLATARAAAASRAKVVLIGEDRPAAGALARCTDLGVGYVQAHASIVSPWAVTAGERTITAASIVIATGCRPALPPVPGLDDIACFTPDTVLQPAERQMHLLVLGGGATGCKLAQSGRRHGSEVTLIERQPRLLATEDEAVSAAVTERLQTDGVRVLTRWQPRRARPAGQGGILEATDLGTGILYELEFDQLLVATGRAPRTADLGLEQLGVGLTADGGIAVNEYLQTSFPNILACGAVTDPDLPTDAGVHQAWYCAMNALYGRFWRLPVDCRAIPHTLFTDPEVIRVGLTESEAGDEGLDVKCVTYGLEELDRPGAGGDDRGFVKVLTPAHDDRILGVTVVGCRAGDIIERFALGMRTSASLRKVLDTLHVHPTTAVIGRWGRGNLPASLSGCLLRFAGWLNRRQRGERGCTDLDAEIGAKDGR